jgi:diguanylate cyclase (GGDEF)-like protein
MPEGEIQSRLRVLSAGLSEAANLDDVLLRVDALQEVATRGGLIGSLLHLISTEPSDLGQLAELALQVALDDGSIADSGSLFVAATIDGARAIRLVAKVARTSEGAIVRTDSREYQTFNTGEGIAGSVLETGVERFIPDCSDEPDYLPHTTGSQLVSLLCYPVVHGRTILGVLCLHSQTRPMDLDESDYAHVSSVCSALAVALRASFNDLTMLPNRLLMDRLLADDVGKWTDGEQRVHLAYIDIDRFGEMNTQYGHDAADALIAQMGVLLLSHAGRENTLCHRHGDEFALIIRDKTPEEAEARCQRIREAVDGAPFSIAGNTVRLTISTGLATHQEGEGHRDLMNRADGLNRIAKDLGRNRVHRA